MEASVVINVHAGTRYEQFSDALESVLKQTVEGLEVILVSSAAPELSERIESDYGEHSDVRLVSLATDDGLSAARNAGAEAATGDIVVFTDDDVLAQEGWLSALLDVYRSQDAVGVGGHVVPIWPAGNPGFLPPEFYWLVGVTHPNFVEEDGVQPVRNTFGCNISFRRDAFLAAGGFREDLGKNQENPLQGEEAELCERISGTVWYTPHALVHHRVDPGQLSIPHLHERSFWQGYSKAFLAEDMSAESTFLTHLFTESLPRRIRSPSWDALTQSVLLGTLTAAVGSGYLYGRLRSLL